MRIFAPQRHASRQSARVKKSAEIGRSAETRLPQSLDPIRETAAARGVPAISRPSDRSEREADALASRVLTMSDPQPAGKSLAGTQAPAGDQRLSAPGKPLPSETRTYFEPRFGRDLGAVRIHADADAARSARTLQAHAFTIGRDIVFGAGRFAPETPAGLRLLAHEIAHVLQPPASRPVIQRQPSTDDIEKDVEEERQRFDAAKAQHNDAMKRAKEVADEDQARGDVMEAQSRFAKAREQQARASILPTPHDALQKAGIATRTTVGTQTGGLMDVVLRQSNIMRRFLSTKITIAGAKFIIENSDPEFDSKYRTLNNVKPGSKEWNGAGSVRGFYDRRSDTIYLRPSSNYGHAVHESIHKFSSRAFREMFGGFLDEGVTQYFTNMVLKEQGLEKGRTLYDDNLACASKLIESAASFGLVASLYFDGEGVLTKTLQDKYHVNPRDMHGNSEKWCKLFGAE